jgi:integrase
MIYQIWLDQWLTHYVKPTAKCKTYERYSSVVYNHIVPKLGRYEMDDLNPIQLQKFIAEEGKGGNLKTKGELSANTVNGIINILKMSLRAAHEAGLVGQLIADKLKRPKMTEKRVTCFTPAEQRKIEEYILSHKNDKLLGVIICLYTGLRLGELLALRWSDVDLGRAMLSVTKTCFYTKEESGKYSRRENSPKTPSSLRVIPIPKQLLCVFRLLKRKAKGDYVIGDKRGNAIVNRSYQRSFELLLKKLKIEHKGFHALRHTFATRALESGMDVKTLSELLGHKNAAVTLNRYVHPLMEHKKQMMNILGKNLALSIVR